MDGAVTKILDKPAVINAFTDETSAYKVKADEGKVVLWHTGAARNFIDEFNAEATANSKHITDNKVEPTADATAANNFAADINIDEITNAVAGKTASAAAELTLGKTSIFKELLMLVAKVAIVALVFTMVLTFVFGVMRYGDSSMAPAIMDGDLVLFNKFPVSEYAPGDAVVLSFEGHEQVRRVVATAGDTVDITKEGLVINGELQQEHDIYKMTDRYQDGVELPLIVPAGQVFLLGDNREGVADSRIYGCVKIEETIGKVITLIRKRGI